MEPREEKQQKLARVARELGAAMRKRAVGRWGRVSTARRRLRNRQVWRFRTGSGEPDRFLLLSHQAMTEGENPTERLMAQLESAHWLDRMESGPSTSFMLAPDGRLHGRSAK